MGELRKEFWRVPELSRELAKSEVVRVLAETRRSHVPDATLGPELGPPQQKAQPRRELSIVGGR